MKITHLVIFRRSFGPYSGGEFRPYTSEANAKRAATQLAKRHIGIYIAPV